MGFEDEGSMVNSAASDKMGGDSSGFSDMDSGTLPGAGDGIAESSDWATPSSTGDGMADNTSVGSVNVCS